MRYTRPAAWSAGSGTPVPCSQGIGAAPARSCERERIGHGGEYHAMNRIFLATASPGPC